MIDDWSRFNTMSESGGALLRQGKYTEVEALLAHGYEGMKARAAKIPAIYRSHLPAAVSRLSDLYEATNRPEKAAQWRAKLPRAVAPPPPPRN